MRTKEQILTELDETQKNALVTAKIQLPREVAMQAGVNAPIMATALALLVEVALDIREQLEELNSGITALSVADGEHKVLLADIAGVLGAPHDGALVVSPANADQLEKLAAEGKLPGLEVDKDSQGPDNEGASKTQGG